MRKIKKLLLPMLAVGFCLTAPVGFLTASAEETTAPWASTPFEAGETQLSVHSSHAGDVETGLKVSFPRNGSALKVNENQIGDFSLEYEPSIRSGKYAIDEMQIVLTEIATGREIAIVANHSSDQFTVSVVYENERAGIYYNAAGKEVGLTNVGNVEGLYTVINKGKTTLSFDADEMQILATGEGQTAKLVWDLSKAENDGKSIPTAQAFGEYTVEVIATQTEEQGEVILYSVCDTKLDGFFIEESPTRLYSHVSRYGVVGQEYICPKGYASSLLGGVQEATLTVKSGSTVVAENAQTFTPTAAGAYTLEYGFEGLTKSYQVEVFAERPEYVWTMTESLDASVALGEVKNIPVVEVYGGLNVYDFQKATVSIFCNTEPVAEYADKESGFDFAFQQAGEYQIVYAVNGEEIERFTVNVLASTNVLQSGKLKQEYLLGEQVDLSDVCANIGGQAIEGSVQVKFPSGKIYSNETFVAGQIGKYEVSVKAEQGGTTYVLSQTFKVISQPQGLFTSEDGLNVSYGKSNFTRRNGVKITATAGNQVFTYKNKVDLTKYQGITEFNKNGAIVVRDDVSPLIELSVDPASYDVSAATGFSFNIVDAADENNYLTVTVNQYGGRTTWSYAKVSVCGKTPKGVHVDGSEANRNILYYGKKVGIRTDGYGLIVYHAFDGTTTGSFVAKDSKISIYYDHKEKQVLIPAGGDSYHWVAMDLDDPLLCGSDLWDGFKGNEVYISGMMTGLNAAKADAYVYSVDGNNLENGAFAYDGQPTVSVEGGVSQLYSLKGKTVSLPSAKAFDQYGNGLTDVTVKAYYKNGGQLIDAKIKDGKLATEKAGEYLLKYFAKDHFGNVGYEEVRVFVQETANALTATTNGAEDSGFIEASVTDYAKILPAENIVVENAVNSYEITSAVYFKNGESWESVACENEEFYVKKFGEYKVEYTVVDFVGREAKTAYTLSVEKPTARLYADSKPVYTAFVSENSYEIFDLHVYNFEGDNNGEVVKADVYVNGTLCQTGKYTAERVVQTLEGYQAKTVIIEYKLGDELLESYTVPVLPLFVEEEITDSRGNTYRQTNYRVENYFAVEGDTSVKAEIESSVLESVGGTATFAYPLSANNLSFTLDINEDRNEDLSPIATNVKSITVRLQDAKRANNYLEIVVCSDVTNADNKYAVAYCNGGLCTDSLSGSLVGVTRDYISLRYDNASGVLYDGNNGKHLFTFTKNAEGRSFDGFDGEVYISFKLESTDGQKASMRLRNLGNVIFAKMTATAQAPSVEILGAIPSTALVGETVIIPNAKGSDMFCDVTNVTVSVYDRRTGVFAKDVSGREVSNLPADVTYQVSFTSVGTYCIEYKTKNSRGVENTQSYYLSCSKNEKPSITVNGEIVSKVSLGDTFMLPDYTVGYQSESEDNLNFVVFINPRNRYFLVKASDTLKFDLLGTYRIRYYAADCYGNYQIKEYSIVCE